MRTELEKAWLGRKNLRAEGDKLRAEGAKLRAEGAKLRAEGDKLFINKHIEIHGKEAGIDWEYWARFDLTL